MQSTPSPSPAAAPANAALTDICTEISLQIDMAKQAKEVWDYIGDHAEAINEAKYGGFFGVAQQAVLHEMILAICRAFDDNPRVLSIKQAINSFGTSSNVKIDALKGCLADFGANSAKIANLSDVKLLEFAQKHMRQALQKDINPHLDGIRKIRHEYIAHNARVKTQFDINQKDIEFCLSWAEKFIHMTYKSFGTHDLVPRIVGARAKRQPGKPLI